VAWEGARPAWIGLIDDGDVEEGKTGRQKKLVRAVVDHVTDGGRWLLLVSCSHAAGSTKPVKNNSLPTEVFGYSDMTVRQLGNKLGRSFTVDDIAEVRFYAHTSKHNRVIHFKSGSRAYRQLVLTGDNRQFGANDAKADVTMFAHHTAKLPKAARDMGHRVQKGGLRNHPFYVPFTYVFWILCLQLAYHWIHHCWQSCSHPTPFWCTQSSRAIVLFCLACPLSQSPLEYWRLQSMGGGRLLTRHWYHSSPYMGPLSAVCFEHRC